MSVLLLKDSDVAQALEGTDAVRGSVDTLEGAFRAFARGETSAPTFAMAGYPPSGRTFEEIEKSLNVPLGINVPMDAMVVGIVPIARSHVTYPHSLWNFLMSYDMCNLQCIMEDETLHTYMVGGSFGLSVRWLAREDASILGMIGSGKMARACLRSIAAERNLTEVRVYSPTPASREAFVNHVRDEYGIDCIAFDNPEKVVRGAHIVQCATNAEVRGNDRVLDAEWLDEGTHVATMSRNELGVDVAAIGRIIPSSVPQVLITRPDWEPWKSLIANDELPTLGPDLVEIIGHGATGRTSDRDITVFLGTNLGAQRVAIVSWVYQRALEQGLGQTWELD